MNPNRLIRKSTSIFFAVILGAFLALALYMTIASSLAWGLIFSTLVVFPGAVLGWFVLSLVLYLRAKKRQSDDLPDLKARMQTAIGLLVFLAVMIGLLIGFFAMAISHM